MKPITTSSHAEELLSALVDSDLTSTECIEILDACNQDLSLLNQWNAYHLVGEVLRSTAAGAAQGADMAFVSRLQRRLSFEEVLAENGAVHSHSSIQLHSSDLGVVMEQLDTCTPVRQAANDGSYRWKMVAGFASFAAVCAIAWNVFELLLKTDTPLLALVQDNAQVVVPSPMGLVVRDARLEEQLADHRQLGSAAALQMPSGFFRNAAFEASKTNGR